MITDLTLQRNLEKIRRDFVANVSHELRSPLTILSGFVETMLVEETIDKTTLNKFLNIIMSKSFQYGLNKIADAFQKRAESL